MTDTASPLTDEASPASPITLGDRGRYVLGPVLSRTASATVYVASDSRLSREVVVKVLKTVRADGQAQAPTLAADLLAGARVAARLVHPGIVTVFDAGLCEHDVYIAMERLEGDDLHTRLSGRWRCEHREALRIASRVAAALVFAHEAGVVHGRIEPANVLMTGPNQVKLLNFGIAAVVDARLAASASPATDEAAADSPLRYVPPERLLGEPADERGDVYGLGVLMYELLAGRPAFSGATAQDLRHAVLLSDVAPVHAVNPAVPPAVSAIVARAMARDPALRFASARDMLVALRPTVMDAAAEAVRPAAWRDRRVQGAAALAGVLVVATLGVMALRGRTGPPPRESVARVSPAPALPLAAPLAAEPSEPVGAERIVPRSGINAQADSAARPLAAIAAAASASAKRAAQRAAAAKPAPPPRPAPAPKSAQAPPPAVAPVATRPAPSERAPPVAAAASVAVASAAASASPAPSAPSAQTTPPAPAALPSTAPAPGRGTILLAVEPWGHVEVNGAVVGTAPPMRRLTLPSGSYTITIRNDAFAPYTVGVTVRDDKPANINHRFGS